MRFDSTLDSFYVLGSLWGSLTGPAVCAPAPHNLSRTVHEATWSSGPGAPGAVTAFIEVNVVPMDTERLLAKQTVLVEGGRISTLGPAAQIRIPAGAMRIDGRGKYLIPGLMDMHNHHFLGKLDDQTHDLFSFLASGVTAIRSTGALSLDKVREFRRSLIAIEQMSPRFYLAGKMQDFDKPGLAPDSVIAAYKAAGNDFIQIAPWDVSIRKEHAPRFVDSLLTTARRLGLLPAVEWHEASFEQILAFGTYGGSIDHLYSFTYPFLDSLEQGKASMSALRARAAAIQHAGTWIVPTLDCTERNNGPSPRTIEIRRQVVKALQDAGVGLLLGTEGWYAQNELVALVGAGLTPYQALLTSTRNPAQHMGILDSSGTVAVGKRADLVLLSGNPLADIRYTREPAGVMRAGRWFDRAELDARLLASPKAWFQLEVSRSDIASKFPIMDERNHVMAQHIRTFEALSDSLAVAKPLESERVRRLLADTFGMMRALLPPEMQERFDPILRVWLREQTRKGYRITIAGVSSSAP